jgi:hypothetical protein
MVIFKKILNTNSLTFLHATVKFLLIGIIIIMKSAIIYDKSAGYKETRGNQCQIYC